MLPKATGSGVCQLVTGAVEVPLPCRVVKDLLLLWRFDTFPI